MKKFKKLFTLLVAFAMTLCVFAMAACDTPTTGGGDAHVCEDVCEVCEKCLTDCEEPECAEKCEGHTNEETHVCEDVCEVCEKCTSECTEPECAEKCEGHTNEETHECEDACEECGKCTSECTEPECAEKCEGHTNEETHECEDACEECGKCTSECTEPECEEKCPGEHEEPAPVYTITLVVGEGTLADDAVLEYKTKADGTLDIDGYLPVPNCADHWTFDNWYTAATGGNAVVEATTVFTADASIYARYVRDDGIWKDNGATWLADMSRNNGFTPPNEKPNAVQYWLGSMDATVSLNNGDQVSFYIDGKLCTGIWITGVGVQTEVSPKPSVINVTRDDDFSIYLTDYNGDGTDYVVQFATNTKGEAGSEDDIPVGAGKITIKIGSLEDITIYLVKANGDAVTAEEFSNYCIYTFTGNDPVLFGDWTACTTNGRVKAEISVSGTAVPEGWIFRWGSSYGTQTADIKNVIKEGGTYVIKLPATNNGEATVTVIG